MATDRVLTLLSRWDLSKLNCDTFQGNTLEKSLNILLASYLTSHGLPAVECGCGADIVGNGFAIECKLALTTHDLSCLVGQLVLYQRRRPDTTFYAVVYGEVRTTHPYKSILWDMGVKLFVAHCLVGGRFITREQMLDQLKNRRSECKSY